MYASVVDTPFFKDMISPEDQSWVESLFIEREYPKGQVIFFHGDEGNEMYIIKSGTLKIFRSSESQEIIFGHQFPGEAIGELEVFHYDNRRTASVAAIEKTTLWIIKKTDLLELSKTYPEILRKTIYILSERLTQADRKLEYLSFLDIRVRVANLLLDLYSNFGLETEEGLYINWKITQQHFANMIGSGRESTARTIQQLQQEGIIHIKGRQYYILDLAKLQDLAGAQKGNIEGRIWHSTHKYDISSV
ncbi:Crp/Fnr family transcriptional regulator [Paenibacillaceae bacterium]|nr:Crp/Fnr family transcriptional regulator [Paenibacillaceae bacterium]